MDQEKPKGRKPDFSGNGVGVWINPGKEGKAEYLTIKVVGHSTITAFKLEEKPK